MQVLIVNWSVWIKFQTDFLDEASTSHLMWCRYLPCSSFHSKFILQVNVHPSMVLIRSALILKEFKRESQGLSSPNLWGCNPKVLPPLSIVSNFVVSSVLCWSFWWQILYRSSIWCREQGLQFLLMNFIEISVACSLLFYTNPPAPTLCLSKWWVLILEFPTVLQWFISSLESFFGSLFFFVEHAKELGLRKVILEFSLLFFLIEWHKDRWCWTIFDEIKNSTCFFAYGSSWMMVKRYLNQQIHLNN